MTCRLMHILVICFDSADAFITCRECSGEDSKNCPKQDKEGNLSSCTVNINKYSKSLPSAVLIKVNSTNRRGDQIESDIKTVDLNDCGEWLFVSMSRKFRTESRSPA